MASVERVPEAMMHGIVGVNRSWDAPHLVTYCDKDARPGYTSMKAHEYEDSPSTLQAKVAVLASLIRHAKHCSAYTGAGISTASGIDDYASKAKQSIATGSRAQHRKNKPISRGDSAPTYSHFVLVAMYRAGLLSHWVQQNHDGLPQKAGFPQTELNEIHGSWFDPSNPVVPMSGSLRDDLLERLELEQHATDLCLTMGTSLCGMNADSMVEVPAKKAFARRRQAGLGSVIIGIQRTAMDHLATLRIFAKIDDVMALLAQKLSLHVPTAAYRPSIPSDCIVHGRPNVFLVPYNHYGTRSTPRLRSQGEKPPVIEWDLSVGARVKLTAGPGEGFEGVIVATPKNSKGAGDFVSEKLCYYVRLPCTREGERLGQSLKTYKLGLWWVEAACNGSLGLLPLVNV
eukprot:CAMPEP_0185728178 /NCGR_PEP_ID=MMETSP1171-20130828/3617_1 /TAXON_ID=374046 /ORGANISM="Helicotheca tamensis, Strain CCMP826" /LENGTH=399 /DNA_ID=CAMNT_0028396853 /DNA_START=206 /DNA_END=1405 /DNA_ORIENTATION=-